MTEKEQLMTTLKQLADVVTMMFGNNCEVAIHDLTTEQKGLVYITGDITGRKLGTPVTDSVNNALLNDGNMATDRHCFMTLTDDGRELKSSTSYIKDSNGAIVAAFCINFETTDHHNAIQLLESFVNRNVKNGSAKDKPEKMSFSIDNTLDSMFERAVTDVGKRPASMSTSEKLKLVKILDDEGAFQIRGVVNQLALRLGVSNFTIYNYLKKIRAVKATGT